MEIMKREETGKTEWWITSNDARESIEIEALLSYFRQSLQNVATKEQELKMAKDDRIQKKNTNKITTNMPIITETNVTLTIDEYNRMITQLKRDAGIIDFCQGSYMNSLVHTQFGDFS